MIFRNVNYFGEYTPRSQIRENIIWQLRESLINLGAYYNISSGNIGYGGEDISILKPSYRPQDTGFKFWRGLSADWVWESATPTYTGGQQPISISGIWMNGTFLPTGTTGNNEFYIDYARGGVVFASEKPKTTIVACNRTERAGFVYPTKSTQYKTLFVEHLRQFESYVPGSGVDALPPELQAFLPAIFVDVTQTNGVPFQLGNIDKIQNFEIVFDVVCEDPFSHDVLSDCVLSLASQGTVLFDLNQAISNNKFPLDYKGALINQTAASSGLQALYPWKTARMEDNFIENDGFTTLPLYKTTIAGEINIIL